LEPAEVKNFPGEFSWLITSGEDRTIRTPPIKNAKINARNGKSAFSRTLLINLFII